jgi:YfiH family protein
MKLEFKRKDGINTHAIECRDEGPVPYLYFPLLELTGAVRHGFSTKLGGVSRGEFATLNFTSTRGDDPEAVAENYRRFAAAIGVNEKDMVLSWQTHTTNIRICTEADRGMGITKARPYGDVDGLMTDVPGLVLVTFYADCVPLYFLDPVKKVIALSHSGWKGTVNRMGEVTVRKMQEVYGSDPADILACIGPSICRDCYEIGSDVAVEFEKAFSSASLPGILKERPDGKYQLDLWEANRIILHEAGIIKDHMAVTDICTCCNPELLFSHRATAGRRGNLGAFLSLC